MTWSETRTNQGESDDQGIMLYDLISVKIIVGNEGKSDQLSLNGWSNMGAIMYLKSARLKHFRSFDYGEIEFQNDLTVLVGENNGGKSNVIDALRLLTLPLGRRREIYCEQTDVRFQSGSDHFELEAHYADLSVGQQGRFISAATDSSLTNACFGLRYDCTQTVARPLLWGGERGKRTGGGMP